MIFQFSYISNFIPFVMGLQNYKLEDFDSYVIKYDFSALIFNTPEVQLTDL